MDIVRKYYQSSRLGTIFTKMATLFLICSYLMVILPSIAPFLFGLMVMIMFLFVVIWLVIGISLIGIPFLIPEYRSFGQKFLNFAKTATLQTIFDFFNSVSCYIKYISLIACILFFISWLILKTGKIQGKRKTYNVIGLFLTFILFVISLVVNFSWHVSN